MITDTYTGVITCTGAIGIVSTKKKSYWYKRKGYYIGKSWVKPKSILKHKNIPIKEPYLYGEIQLKVDTTLILGAIYIDENGKKYICVLKNSITQDKPFSVLYITSLNLGLIFSPPTQLTLIYHQLSNEKKQQTD